MSDLAVADGATDLVVIPQGARPAILAAVEGGDVAGLRDLSARATAQAVFARRNKLFEEVEAAVRVQVEAEAGLGLMSFSNPELFEPGSLGGEWRLFAAGLERGLLDEAFAELGGKPIAHWVVSRYLKERGAYQTYLDALLALTPKGMKPSRVAITAGFNPGALYPHSDGRCRIAWWKAKKICEVFDINPLLLPYAHRQLKKKRPRRLWLRREIKTTGSGRWDKAYGTLRQALQAFSAVADPEDLRYDEIYEHWYAINDYLQKRLAREK